MATLSDHLDKTCGRGQWKKIGQGAYGSIFLCQHETEPYVLKVQPVHNLDELEQATIESKIPGWIDRRCHEAKLECTVLPQIGKELRFHVRNVEYMVTKMKFANYGSAKEFVVNGGFQGSMQNFVENFFYLANDLYVLQKKLHRVHRDIKPGNILVSKNNTKYVFYLADFGLSCIESKCTGAKGTLDYMLPAIIGPKELWNSPSLDIYALGVSWFEILAGQAYVQNSSHLAKDISEIMFESIIPEGFIKHLKDHYHQSHQVLEKIYDHWLEREPDSVYIDVFEAVLDMIFDMMNPFSTRPTVDNLMDLEILYKIF